VKRREEDGALPPVVSTPGAGGRPRISLASLITGAADDDPCAIGTYAKAGAAFGNSMLWTALVTFPMMSTVVFLAAKIGIVGGIGVAGAMKKRFPKAVVYAVVLALLAANIVEAGADIGAMAASLQLLVPLPHSLFVVVITAIILVTQIRGSYRLLERLFRWLATALFAYAGAAVMARPDLRAVLRGTFAPAFVIDAHSLAMLVAIIGTTLSPYLCFWEASHQVEEHVAQGRHRLWQRRRASKGDLRRTAVDVNSGMFFSSAITYSIILCMAATLHRSGARDVVSAAAAARALQPLAGRAAAALFAIGVVGVGFLAVPVLTTAAAYALAETFGWRRGLDEHPRRAYNFYAAIVASTLIAMVFSVLDVNPIAALFGASVIMGLLAPPLLVMIMLMTNDRVVMGDYVNGPLLNAAGWATTIVVAGTAAALVVSWAA
jgi:NRAMP (natural resistance-associated macrophage protein)-like metal ion transporter